MKEQNEKKKVILKNKRAYVYTALACVSVILTLVIAIVSISYENNVPTTPPVAEDDLNKNPSGEAPDENDQAGAEENKPVDSPADGFVLPVANASLTNEFGFFYNQTLNNYYAHEGLDFKADAGTQVVAVEDGTVESVYVADVLNGTEIVIDHGNGVKTVYRFVTATDGLKAGSKVKKGEIIATVAEANGSEYKDGAHLHFEVQEDGKKVDPTAYLTLEEK